jgi:phosphoesterase RecJ-like protein
LEKAIIDLIGAKQSFLLSGHERPDGDCLGAETALYHLLAALGKDARILNPDPLSATFEFLSRHTPFHSYARGQELPSFDVAVLLDCANLSRLDALGERIRQSGTMVAVIDHHVGSEHGDGAVCLVDRHAPSTGALVYRLFLRLAVPIPQPAAEGIFLSIVSDTGWFRYSNTDERALSIAAEMVRLGVEPSKLYDRINRQHHIDSVRLMQEVLGTHRFEFGGKYAYACIDRVAMAEANRIDFDTDAVLEPLRSVAGIEVVALFKERFDGAVKLSLRASGDIDVAAIAASCGGGGHVKAAGATLSYPLPRAVEIVGERIREALLAAGQLGAGA